MSSMQVNSKHTDPPSVQLLTNLWKVLEALNNIMEPSTFLRIAQCLFHLIISTPSKGSGRPEIYCNTLSLCEGLLPLEKGGQCDIIVNRLNSDWRDTDSVPAYSRVVCLYTCGFSACTLADCGSACTHGLSAHSWVSWVFAHMGWVLAHSRVVGECLYTCGLSACTHSWVVYECFYTCGMSACTLMSCV